MDYSFTLKEYGYFIKYNIKTIITVMIVTVTLVMGGFIYSQYFSADSPQQNQLSNEIAFDEGQMQQLLAQNFDELSANQQNELLQHLEAEAYYFRLYIEDENGNPYTQFRTLKELITTKELTIKIENAVQDEFKPDSKRGVILGIDPSTNLITVQVGVGNSDLNQEIAQYYYDFIKSSTFDFNKNKTIYYIDAEPMQNSGDNNEIEPEEVINQEVGSGMGTTIVLAMISLIAGLILGILLSLVKNIFNKKISYLFDYKLSRSDSLYKFMNGNEQDKFIFTVLNPQKMRKIVVSEQTLEHNMIEKLNENATNSVTFVNDISEGAPHLSDTDLIIVTQLNQTNKNWYTEQLRKVSILNMPVKVIQI